AERGPMIQSLSPDARATYERLSRMRSGFALAEARDYSCMACRMKIRPQVFADIRKGDSIITCESCGRILYFKVEAAVTRYAIIRPVFVERSRTTRSRRPRSHSMN